MKQMNATATVTAKAAPAPEYNHLIGAFVGDPDGPTLIAIGSLHGNEPAGALALEDVALRLDDLKERLRGRVYLIAGNMRALRKRVRFIDGDLNRSWTWRNLSAAGKLLFSSSAEGQELSELLSLLDSLLITARHEVYVIDLHSTSAGGVPFATVGDTIRNRTFARKFPVTTLLGVEEQLDGTLLEYLNNAGAVTLGFEGGKHDSAATIENHVAFTMLALVNSGILRSGDIPDMADHHFRLAAGVGGSHFYEVLYREAITPADSFKMKAGFTNFDAVAKGQVLAENKNGAVAAPIGGVLLMPLYQKLGEDGFFIGRRVALFWLTLSAALRKLKVQRLIHLLPGVHRDPLDPVTLVINTRVARLFPLQIFHLLGYRKRRWSGAKLIVSRRKHDTTSPFMTYGR